MSRGICGILCTTMEKLRFLCFASLCAVLIICLAGHGNIGLADLADPVGVSMPSEVRLSKVPLAPGPVYETADAGGSAGVVANENRHESEPSGNKSSGTITIIMTGIVEDPGDLGGE